MTPMRRVALRFTRTALVVESRVALQSEPERLKRVLGWLGLASVAAAIATWPIVAPFANAAICLPLLALMAIASLLALRMRDVAPNPMLMTGVALSAQTLYTIGTGDADSPYLAGFTLIVLAVAAVAPVGRTAAAALQGGGGLLLTAMIDARLEAQELLAVTNQVVVMLAGALLVSGMAWRRRLDLRRVARNVERARSEASFHERESRTDPLTGCRNRRAFEEDLVALGGPGSYPALAVVFVDADNLKGVNDRLGHDAGDRMLQALVDRLAASLRSSERIYRIGGDEFAAIVPAADLEGLSARLGDQIRAECDGIGIVSASVGTVLGRDDDTAETLVRRADRAMYEAKRKALAGAP
jgi:diguanylate cyclase (GGDEF)-like protein